MVAVGCGKQRRIISVRRGYGVYLATITNSLSHAGRLLLELNSTQPSKTTPAQNNDGYVGMHRGHSSFTPDFSDYCTRASSSTKATTMPGPAWAIYTPYICPDRP
jgi:hypothetical protein